MSKPVYSRIRRFKDLSNEFQNQGNAQNFYRLPDC